MARTLLKFPPFRERALCTQLPQVGELFKDARGGARPPVKPLALDLRRPWLRPRPGHPGRGSLTGSTGVKSLRMQLLPG